MAGTLLAAQMYYTWAHGPVAWYDSATNHTLYTFLKEDGTNWTFHQDHARRRLFSRQGLVSDGSADDHNHGTVISLHTSGPRPGEPLFTYTGHNNGLRVLGALIPGKIGALRGLLTPSISNTATYPLPCQVANTARSIYYFHRHLTFGTPNEWRHRFTVSTDGGATWAAAFVWLIDDDGATVQRPYLKIAHEPNTSRIDFIVTVGHYNEVSDQALFTGYIDVAADGVRTYRKSDGTSVGVDGDAPFIPSDFTQVVAPNASFNYAFVDFGYVEGVLTLIYLEVSPYATDANTVHTYYWTQLVAGAWTTPEEICEGGETSTTPHYYWSSAWFLPGGACLDPNDADAVYVSRKQSAGNFQIFKYTRTGPGTWVKGENLSGNTGNLNITPAYVRNANPTRIIYCSGTHTSDTVRDMDVYTWPEVSILAAPLAARVKPTASAWNANFAPGGAESYSPFTEGTGTTVADKVPGGLHPGTFVGTPAWAVGSLGPEINTFATGSYIAHTFTTQDIYRAIYPFGVAVLFRFTGTGADQVPVSIGNSGGTSQFVLINLNAGGVANRVRWNGQSTGGQGWLVESATVTVNDGNPHVAMGVMWSATHGTLFVDGQQLAEQTNATISGVPVFNIMTTGALRRTTVTNVFTGAAIAVAHFEGGAPDPLQLAEDWLFGVFAAIRPGDSRGAYRTGTNMTQHGIRSGGIL